MIMENRNKATRMQVSTFGILAGLAGLEHGIGEITQGNTAPGAFMFKSWGESELFRIVNGEPAMSIIPNLLASGIVTVIVSAVFLVWAAMFVHRKRGGLVMILISAVLLLVGGGFGPPLLGIIFGAVGTRIHAPLSWWRARVSSGMRRFLSKAWPWIYGACVAAWLAMFPGTLILGRIIGADNPAIMLSFISAAFGLLPFMIITGFAYDAHKRVPGD